MDYDRLACPYIEKEVNMATPITVERLCALAGVSRAGFYRWRHRESEPDPDLDLRDRIQRIALEWLRFWRRG